MEYVVGPVLALLIGMKFSDYKTKELQKKVDTVIETVDQKIVEQNKTMSQQTLKIVMPVAKSVTKINEQLGLWLTCVKYLKLIKATRIS